VPPVHTFTTTAADGDMRDRRNRELLAKCIGLAPDRFVWLDQVHGTRVGVVDQVPTAALTLPETDGVVTSVPGVALAILTADCVPVTAHDPRARVIGAAHAGRAGAQRGIAIELMTAMMGLGARPERITASLGPSASGARYEVPVQMRDEVEADLPGSACVTQAGAPGLDIRAGLVRRLRELGVREVETSGVCTIDDPRYFSYRRGRETGRFATVIWMEPQA
jgi:hypothetical protein